MSIPHSKLSTRYYLVDPDVTDNHGDSSIEGSLQWALNTFGTDGGVIELVPGTYETKNNQIELKTSTTIIGAGIDSIIYRDQATYGYTILNANSVGNITLRNFALEGVTSAQSLIVGVINVDASYNLHIERIWNTVDFGYSFILIKNTGGIHIVNNNKFEGLRGNGVILYNCWDIDIFNNVFDVETTTGFSANHGVYLSSSRNIHMNNNHIFSTSTNQKSLLRINECHDLNISENVIRNYTGGVTTHGNILIHDSDNTIIENNVIQGNGSGHGIFIEDNSDSISIRNNSIRSFSGYGIYWYQASTSRSCMNIYESIGTGNVYIGGLCTNVDDHSL